MNKTAHPDEDGTPVTPPLPDRIAAAIDDLTIAQAECTWAEAGTFTLRSEKDDRAKEARDARSKLVEAIAEVVAERDLAVREREALAKSYRETIDERDAATKRADGIAAELAAAQAKLATAVGALKTAQRILAECGEDSMEVDDAIAAAEQGGA